MATRFAQSVCRQAGCRLNDVGNHQCVCARKGFRGNGLLVGYGESQPIYYRRFNMEYAPEAIANVAQQVTQVFKVALEQRLASSSRRAHQMCSVLMWPCRMDFSRRAQSLQGSALDP